MDVKVIVKSTEDVDFTDIWTLEDLPEFLSPDEVMREVTHEFYRVYGLDPDLYIANLYEV